MSKIDKILLKLLAGTSDKNISFNRVVSLYESFAQKADMVKKE